MQGSGREVWEARLPEMTRRTAVVLGVLALAGCSPLSDPAPADPSPSPSAPRPTSGGPTPTPTSTPVAVPAPTTAATSAAESQFAGATQASVIEALDDRAPQQWGLNLPGHLVRVDGEAVVLTLDACGGPNGSGVDVALLDVLRQLDVPAMLFLNARWIDVNRSLAEDLAAEPLFALASHGSRHLPLSVSGQSAYGIRGTASLAEAVDEIVAADAWFLEHTGAPSVLMRPGTAFTDDVAVEAARMLGRSIVGFSVNGDAGATFSADQVAAALGSAAPGDIVIAHMNQPGGGAAEGFRQALPVLLDRGVAFAHLS
ncbi:polysaccharide deacetylase family protein [Agrococcus beijingensis]|uniref:polysaccharide deacetylase family protein n=1 Tax=Agrococcus beijingensis TaxID=3068634 RepID=UPI00274081BC|nr:polysaccharide deacetylase family protein [Agrococcus sp. REN33]